MLLSITQVTFNYYYSIHINATLRLDPVSPIAPPHVYTRCRKREARNSDRPSPGAIGSGGKTPPRTPPPSSRSHPPSTRSPAARSAANGSHNPRLSKYINNISAHDGNDNSRDPGLTRTELHRVSPSVQPDRPGRTVRPVRYTADDGPEPILGVPLEPAHGRVMREQLGQRLIHPPP